MRGFAIGRAGGGVMRACAMAAVLAACVLSAGSTGPAAAAPRGDIWAGDCKEQSSGYLVICERYGGADFQRLVPPQCDFGSRLGCHLTACQMADHFHVRAADGRVMAREELCVREDDAGADEAPQPAHDPANANCAQSAFPRLCYACAEKGAGAADYFCARFLE